MSSTWSQNNEKSLVKSIIKNQTTDDDEHSNLSSSSNTTTSSPHTSNNQLESIYSDSTTLKNLQQEQYSTTNGNRNLN
jgi:hypothetical protein